MGPPACPPARPRATQQLGPSRLINPVLDKRTRTFSLAGPPLMKKRPSRRGEALRIISTHLDRSRPRGEPHNAVNEPPRARAPALYTSDPGPATFFCRREGFKNWCKRNGRNKPKRGKRTRCRYCDDVRAGVHWTLRNKKGCARLESCIAKKYAIRKPSECLCPFPSSPCRPPCTPAKSALSALGALHAP